MFTLDQFNKQFAADLDTLKNSERITRETLRSISRYMLEHLHNVDCDIRPIKKLLDVLTPLNKAAAIEYFKEFSGFSYNKDKGFTSKNQAKYEEVRATALEFLEDPHNNIWTWAARNLEVKPTAKPFDPKEVEKMVAKQLKKAANDNVADAQAQILMAVLSGGIDANVLTKVLDSIESNKEKEAAQA